MKHNIIISTLLLAVILFCAACTDNDREFYLEAPELEGPTDFEPVDLPVLHVEGRYLKDATGNIVNLHGFAQTYSPFFNNGAWSGYDVDACLNYNQKCIDGVLAAGWKMNFIRQHMDPHWTSPGAPNEANAHVYFDVDRFMKYLNVVFIPMAEYAIERGCYVVMRPPGVCPETIAVDDDYNEYLIQVWDSVSNHPRIKNNSHIMFELANEPVNIIGTDGTVGASTNAHFEALQLFLQPIVDRIRENGCDNIVWLPGLGYQSLYQGCATYKVEDSNMGYAVHCYCGWYGSDAEQDSGEGIGTPTGTGYASFQQGWDKQVGPVSDIAPIMVTEMDWAPVSYNSSWGKGTTGTAGGFGFGANFKYITDNSGNVSWLFFTEQQHLTEFKDEPGTEGNYTFLNDPEACPWPIYHWFKEYAEGATDHGSLVEISLKDVTGNELTLSTGSDKYLLVQAKYSDGTTELVTADCSYVSTNPETFPVEKGRLTALADGDAHITITYAYKGESKELTFHVTASSFDLNELNPHIWDPENVATYNTVSHRLITAPYGFGGWQYASGLNLSASNYLVVELSQGTNVDGETSFRLFDIDSYWVDAASYPVKDYRLIIDLHDMETSSGVKVDPSHLYIIGFWTLGGADNAVVINRVYTTQTAPTDTYTPPVPPDEPGEPGEPEEPEEPENPVGDDLFPLSDLNPSIWGDGTFTTDTHELLTGRYGFAGWSLESSGESWDLSKYRYLIVELDEGSAYDKNAWSFRLFDDGYWGGQVEIEMASEVTDNRLVVDLEATWMKTNGNLLNMSRVNIVGFWSWGDPDPIYIKRVYVAN